MQANSRQNNFLLSPSFLYRALFITILLLAVILPRLAALGHFPYMDEGYHAFMASYIHQSYLHGNGFPQEMTGYKLYPYMTAALCNLPGNTMLWLRLADLLFALGMACVFCKLLVAESGSKLAGLLIGFSFLLGLNYSGAIQNGYKNSFFPAFLCLCWALCLIRNASSTSSRWYWAGGLTALGILFRETFVLFPFIGVCSLLVEKNFRGCFKFILGGILGAAIITLISALLRDQWWKIFEFYFVYGRIYEPEAAKRIIKFFQNGSKAALIYSPLVITTLLVTTFSFKNLMKYKKGRAAFWLACALAPLVEPYLKIGFLYHFSACLPGLAGLCAIGYAHISPARPKLISACNWALVLCALVMLPTSWAQYEKLPITLKTIGAFPGNNWPRNLTPLDTTLRAAEKIHTHLPPGGRVSSSGFAYFIFPTSRSFPPSIQLGDLSRTWIYSDYNEAKFNEMLKKSPPDLVLLAKTDADHSETFYKTLKNIFNNNPEYKYIDSVEPNQSLNYGWLGYDIYKHAHLEH